MIWLMIVLVLVAGFIAAIVVQIGNDISQSKQIAVLQTEKLEAITQYLFEIDRSIEELHPDKIEAKRRSEAYLDDLQSRS